MRETDASGPGASATPSVAPRFTRRRRPSVALDGKREQLLRKRDGAAELRSIARGAIVSC